MPVVAPNPELPLAEQQKTLRVALDEKTAGYRAEGNSFGLTTLRLGLMLGPSPVVQDIYAAL
jgi:hypothetical protein